MSFLWPLWHAAVFSKVFGSQCESEDHIEDHINYFDERDEADANPEVKSTPHRPQ